MGWSRLTIILPTTFMIFFPLTINIYQGFRNIPQNLMEMFLILKASTWKIFLKLQLPYTLPYVFAGWRIATAISSLSAAAGELAGGQQGLGVLMHESYYNANILTAFGCLACLTCISSCLYLLAIALEYLWQKKHSLKKIASYSCLAIATLITFSNLNTPVKSSLTSATLLLDWFPNPNHVPLYVGQQQQIFAKHNLDLNIVKLQEPADTIPLLTTGKVQLAVYYMPYAIKAADHGAKFTVAGQLISQPSEILIFPNQQFTHSLQDFDNKTLSYCHDGVYLKHITNTLLANHIQLKATQKISFNIILAIATHTVDICTGAYSNIEPIHLKHLSITTTSIPLSFFGVPPYYELIILANEKFATTHPQLLKNFSMALQESIDFCRNNAEQAFTIYAKANSNKNTFTLTWEKEAWQKTLPLLATHQNIDPNLWENFAQWMYQQHLR